MQQMLLGVAYCHSHRCVLAHCAADADAVCSPRMLTRLLSRQRLAPRPEAPEPAHRPRDERAEACGLRSRARHRCAQLQPPRASQRGPVSLLLRGAAAHARAAVHRAALLRRVGCVGAMRAASSSSRLPTLTRRAPGIPVRTYTHEVVTLWYRAPEILLGAHDARSRVSAPVPELTQPPRAATAGAKHYSTPVDLWCVAGVAGAWQAALTR